MRETIKDLWNKLNEISYAFDFCFLENENETLLNIYYNPDSNCGGQIVVDTYPVKEIIMPYLESIDYNLDNFQWGDISGEINSKLYDMDNEDLADEIIELVNKCLWKSKPRQEVLAPLLPLAHFWLIGVGGSENDNVFTERVFGTKEQVKKYLVKMVLEDKKEDDCWEYGTESVEEVEENHFGEGRLYAFGCYSSYHIDYTATPDKEPVSVLKEPERKISQMSSSELFEEMTGEQKDDIYRKVWFGHVVRDAKGIMMGAVRHNIPEDDEQFESLAECIAKDFVYEGEYDCNISYWDNIYILLDKWA